MKTQGQETKEPNGVIRNGPGNPHSIAVQRIFSRTEFQLPTEA